jgi:hypothetical protein
MWTLLGAGVFGSTEIQVVPTARPPCSAVVGSWKVVLLP